MQVLSGWQPPLKKIKIDNRRVNATLTDFKFCVKLTASNAASVFFAVGNNFRKIAVTQNDGTTQLKVEVAYWDATEQVGVLWIKETLNGANAHLWLYADNNRPDNTSYVGFTGESAAQDVWGTMYDTVLTLEQEPDGTSGDIKDSTSSGNNFTSHNMGSGNLVSGDVEHGLYFNGVNEYLDGISSFESGDFTLSFFHSVAYLSMGEHTLFAKGDDYSPGGEGPEEHYYVVSMSDEMDGFVIIDDSMEKSFYKDSTESLITFIGYVTSGGEGTQYTLKIYENGSHVATKTSGSQIFPSISENLKIGLTDFSGDNPYTEYAIVPLKGRIYNVKINNSTNLFTSYDDGEDNWWLRAEYENLKGILVSLENADIATLTMPAICNFQMNVREDITMPEMSVNSYLDIKSPPLNGIVADIENDNISLHTSFDAGPIDVAVSIEMPAYADMDTHSGLGSQDVDICIYNNLQGERLGPAWIADIENHPIVAGTFFEISSGIQIDIVVGDMAVYTPFDFRKATVFGKQNTSIANTMNGDNSYLNLFASIGISPRVLGVINTMCSYSTQILSMLEIAKGDPSYTNYIITSLIKDSKTKFSIIQNTISSGENVSLLLYQELKGDFAKLFGNLSASITDGNNRVLEIPITLAEGQEKHTQINTTIMLNDETHSLYSMLRVDARDANAMVVSLEVPLPEGKSNILNALNVFSENGNKLPVSIQNIIDETTGNKSFSSLMAALESGEPLTPSFRSQDYKIFIDGINVTNRVKSARITSGKDVIHKSVSIPSMDADLYQSLSVYDRVGEQRIEIQIGSQFWLFLIEDISGDEVNFTITGRSLSALCDQGYNTNRHFTIDEPTSAKDVAESILPDGVILDWDTNIPDWILPENFEYTGYPITGLRQIAKIAGAIVQGKQDNTVSIEMKYSVRPIDMASHTPDATCDRSDNLLSISFQNEKGSGFDAIEIIGAGSDIQMPDIEVEEEPEIGHPAYLRIFWGTNTPPEHLDTWVTGGKIHSLGETTSEYGLASLSSGRDYSLDPMTDDLDRYVFKNGITSLQRPITEITFFRWIGDVLDQNGDVVDDPGYEFTAGEKELRMTNGGQWGIAEIIFNTTYHRYEIYDHYIKMLQAVFSLSDEDVIGVWVRMLRMDDLDAELGDNFAPGITDVNLTSEEIAVHRGTAFLDDSRYNRINRSISIPYDEDVHTENILYINNDVLQVSSNHYVKSCDIIIEGPKITQEIEAVEMVIE